MSSKISINFCKSIKKKSYLANKQTEFLLTSEAFDQTNNDILIRLLGIAQTQQLIGQAGIQVKGKLDKKYLLLPVEYRKRTIRENERCLYAVNDWQR